MGEADLGQVRMALEPGRAAIRAAPLGCGSTVSAPQSRQSVGHGVSSGPQSQAAPRTPLASPWRGRHQPRRHLVGEDIATPKEWDVSIEPLDLAEPAADHDHMGIDQVDDRGQRAGQPVS